MTIIEGPLEKRGQAVLGRWEVPCGTSCMCVSAYQSKTQDQQESFQNFQSFFFFQISFFRRKPPQPCEKCNQQEAHVLKSHLQNRYFCRVCFSQSGRGRKTCFFAGRVFFSRRVGVLPNCQEVLCHQSLRTTKNTKESISSSPNF